MNQALHILKKDVRHLWWEIFGVLLLTITYAVVDSQRSMPGNEAGRVSTYPAIALVLGWYYLVGLVVFEEPLATEIQFWVTRPYTWTSLLGAKVLFIILFTNLPLLLAQCAVLAATGFAPTPYLPGLLWKQLGLTVVFLLPAFAMASIAIGLVQYTAFTIAFGLCWAALVVVADAVARASDISWAQLSVLGAVMAAAAVTVLLRQYARRTTFASRGILLCAATLMVATGALGRWTPVPALRESIITGSYNTSLITLGFEKSEWTGPPRSAIAEPYASNEIRSGEPATIDVSLPIQVSGLSAGLDLDASGLNVSLEGPSGQMWRFSGHLLDWNSRAAFVRRDANVFIVRLPVARAFFDEVKSGTVECRMSIDLTLFGDLSATQLPGRGSSVLVPGLGLCLHKARNGLVCNSPLRRPSRIVFQVVDPAHCMPDSFLASSRQTWNSGDWNLPFPAEFGFSPLASFDVQEPSEPSYCPGTRLTMTPQRSLAHFRRELAIPDLRLADYAPLK
jgi:hypothetical protein